VVLWQITGGEDLLAGQGFDVDENGQVPLLYTAGTMLRVGAGTVQNFRTDGGKRLLELTSFRGRLNL
jgi:hypothetical protein